MSTFPSDNDSLELVPIQKEPGLNRQFNNHPECMGSLDMTLQHYKRVGFNIPWIGYYARLNGEFVGSSGYKGKPVNGRVEIAYGTFPQFQNRGIGTRICRKMVLIARESDPSVRICARTFANDNASSRILQKNNFNCLGTVIDEEDGEVWEWEYQRTILPA